MRGFVGQAHILSVVCFVGECFYVLKLETGLDIPRFGPGWLEPLLLPSCLPDTLRTLPSNEL